MRSVAVRCLLFLLVGAPIHLAASAAFERAVFDDLNFRISERQLDARVASGRAIRTLVLGDSHAYSGADPDVLGDAFNFASSGENAAQTFGKLRWVLAAAPTVDVVVLPVDLHSFATFRARRFDRPALWDRYVDWAEVGRTTGDPLSFLGLAASAHAPYVSGADDALLALTPGTGSATNRGSRLRDGFRPFDDSFADHPAAAQRAATRARNMLEGGDPFEPVSFEYFRRSLELCADHGVRVALVRYPVSEEYWREAVQKVDPEAFYARVQETARRYAGTRLFDHHADYFGRNEKLRDPDHLNAKGAAEFSSALRDEIAALRAAPR